MPLRELGVRRSYDTGVAGADVLNDFYIPALSESCAYDRLSGFFSSRALAVAARGIAGLIRNDGRMRLAVSPRLQPADIEALNQSVGTELQDSLLSNRLVPEFDMGDLVSQIARDHVRALCWMLANELLDMRVVVPAPQAGADAGIYHQKIGVLSDGNGDVLSFSGSINETAKGWLGNIEQFKVFRSWVDVESEYVSDDVRTFSRYWDGTSGATRTVELPDAVRESLLSYAPDDVESLGLEIARETSPGWGEGARKKFLLRPYQKDAIAAWFEADGHGILEMATGTGKTRTALSAAEQLSKSAQPLLIVISVPYQHLATQWLDEVVEALPGADIIFAGGGRTSWRKDFVGLTSRMALGASKLGVVIAVHNTAGSGNFATELDRARGVCPDIMLIADEMHALGAPKLRSALWAGYRWRLGLSATPQRWFDDDGTALLEDFFGQVVFVFGIEEALKTIDPSSGETVLCPYDYFPHFVSLTDNEIQEYVDLTQKLVRSHGREVGAGDSTQSLEELFLFLRAGIVKRAEQKMAVLDSLLDQAGPQLDHCIIYCMDREQMNDVAKALQQRSIVYRFFTGEEGMAPDSSGDGSSERQRILRSFERGDTAVLVAMKCLDEGVDVKQARTGVVLASSTNPREFIQRRGRLLRRAPGKRKAIVHDVIVRPSQQRLGDPETRALELRLFKKELDRLGEFAACADNASECYTAVLDEIQGLMS